MKKIEVYQSLWGMTDLPCKESPWSTEEQVNQIKAAGFDGALQFVDDNAKETHALSELITSKDLKLGISCFGYSVEDVESKLDYAKKYNAEFVNIMVKDYFKVDKEATLLLEKIIKYAKNIGVLAFIETHRGTITQDLIRTTEYVKSIPELALTIDFSHYIVSGEIDVPNENVELCFDALLKKAAAIHIRISNGEQIQVPIHALKNEQYDNFIRWWKKGIQYSCSYGTIEKPFPIVIELGPEAYQQKIRTDEGVWIYDCNRWDEALKWKEIVRKF